MVSFHTYLMRMNMIHLLNHIHSYIPVYDCNVHHSFSFDSQQGMLLMYVLLSPNMNSFFVVSDGCSVQCAMV